MIKQILLSLFSQNSLYFLGLDLHFLRVRLRNLFRLRGPSQIKPAANYLNVGCGAQGIDSPDWFNLDGWPAKGVDLEWDLRRSLPFENQRFRSIFSEHFLKHLFQDDARQFLCECLRVLQPGGWLRISVPDGELYLKGYCLKAAWMLAEIANRGWLVEPGWNERAPMELVNDVFRQPLQHQYCYDFQTLNPLLAEVGFEAVTRVDFGTGAVAQLQIDQQSRCWESLYVEARKPGLAAGAVSGSQASKVMPVSAPVATQHSLTQGPVNKVCE